MVHVIVTERFGRPRQMDIYELLEEGVSNMAGTVEYMMITDEIVSPGDQVCGLQAVLGYCTGCLYCDLPLMMMN